MGCSNGLGGAHVVFGNTDPADGVPDLLAPSVGPTYLEGRLVLSLSFKGEPDELVLLEESDAPLERYRLWDDLAETWYGDGLEVLRFEWIDVVVRSNPKHAALWAGAMDTRARVVPVPDLDEAGMAVNARCDLCWRRS